MIDDLRRAAGDIGNSPNNDPKNLWIRRTHMGPAGDPVKQDKRPAGFDTEDPQPHIRRKSNPPADPEIKPDPSQSMPMPPSTTVDEDQLDQARSRGRSPPHVANCLAAPVDALTRLEDFLTESAILPNDRHTREILAQHRITRWEHFIVSNERELLALGLTVGAARALCQTATAKYAE
ncbi:uncharacterized protein PGTG_07279 [Puccinia graminis f. sp. tritici CRL 75-36-700-3]|uniref:Uncharacterized protein n=1 Tax=Puccinia graminis f. sp. tritici (strain CRL 75-36-700-3 / race SCCL) TaxID=418459 RepID=E3KA45_PUCGT|nr:uncharacterized protein PGTG_07279 [Puccinia graminis f. sp. tritici CRL 75-36-700-3]EFP81027.2 hypothetical protein PGTG_07279 [Puccinia graminis f. sp. tritici CRL 75-36-700-3]